LYGKILSLGHKKKTGMQIPLFLQQNLRFRTSLKGASTGDEAENLRVLPQRTSTGDEAENLRFRTSLKGASTGDEAETPPHHTCEEHP
jgi:hypothetical protein